MEKIRERRRLQAKTKKGTVIMLLIYVITTSLYDGHEFWIAEARDIKRRIIERVSRSLSRGDVRYGNGLYSLKQEDTNGDLEKTGMSVWIRNSHVYRKVYDADADDK
jgi:hypothetical protein